jgi:hypothetical protein
MLSARVEDHVVDKLAAGIGVEFGAKWSHAYRHREPPESLAGCGRTATEGFRDAVLDRGEVGTDLRRTHWIATETPLQIN